MSSFGKGLKWDRQPKGEKEVLLEGRGRIREEEREEMGLKGSVDR